MAFKEYGNYDAVGLAELVRKKEVTARELLDEAIARTAKVDPQINAVVVKHYDYAERQIERGLPDGPFTGVPFLLKDLDLAGGHAHDLRRHGPEGFCRRPQRHAGAALSRYRRLDLRQELQSRIRPDADDGVAPARADPQSLESRAFFRRVIGRRGGGGCRPHPPRRACQRWRRLDPDPRFRLRRVRPEADPGAQSARSRSRRRLGRLLLRPCREHQRARQRGHDGRDPRRRSRRAPTWRRRRSGRFRRKSAATPASSASPSPTNRPMATPSIRKSRRPCARSRACWRGSAITSRNGRRCLPPIRPRS